MNIDSNRDWPTELWNLFLEVKGVEDAITVLELREYIERLLIKLKEKQFLLNAHKSANKAYEVENRQLAVDFNYAHEKKKQLQAEIKRLKKELQIVRRKK